MGNAAEKRNFERASKFTPGERKGHFSGKFMYIRGKDHPIMKNNNTERNVKETARFINGPPHRTKQMNKFLDIIPTYEYFVYMYKGACPNF